MPFLGGVFKDITLGGVKGVFEGIGSLAKDIRSAITGEISPEKKAEIEAKLIEIESRTRDGQLQINLKEAEHASIFVAGWRPAVGWVCALSLAAYYIPQYVIASYLWIKAAVQVPVVDGIITLPPFPATEGSLMELVLAMLGVAAWRTAEKFKGVARS